LPTEDFLRLGMMYFNKFADCAIVYGQYRTQKNDFKQNFNVEISNLIIFIKSSEFFCGSSDFSKKGSGRASAVGWAHATKVGRPTLQKGVEKRA